MIAAERTQDTVVYGPDEVKAFLRTLGQFVWQLLKLAVKVALVIGIVLAMFYVAPTFMTLVCGGLSLMWLLRKNQ